MLQCLFGQIVYIICRILAIFRCIIFAATSLKIDQSVDQKI